MSLGIGALQPPFDPDAPNLDADEGGEDPWTSPIFIHTVQGRARIPS